MNELPSAQQLSARGVDLARDEELVIYEPGTKRSILPLS